MATNVYLGLTGNWADVSNWSLGAIPVDDDYVIIPDTTQTSLTTNLDQTGLDLSSIYAHEGYGGNIGSTGNPLKCRVTGLPGLIGRPYITHNGSGSFHFYGVGGGTGNIVVNSRNMENAFVLSGTSGCTTLSCVGGKTIVTAGFAGAVTDAFVTQSAEAAPVLQDQSVTAIATLHMNGGTVEYDGDIPTIYMHGGVLTANLASSTTLVHVTGGLYVYNASPDLLGVLMLLGGTVDTTRTSTVKTITELRKAAAGTLLRSTNLTVTNTYDIFDIDTD